MIACEQAPSEVGKKRSASEVSGSRRIVTPRAKRLPPHQTALGSSSSP